MCVGLSTHNVKCTLNDSYIYFMVLSYFSRNVPAVNRNRRLRRFFFYSHGSCVGLPCIILVGDYSTLGFGRLCMLSIAFEVSTSIIALVLVTLCWSCAIAEQPPKTCLLVETSSRNGNPTVLHDGRANFVCRQEQGFRCSNLHGDLLGEDRDACMEAFRQGLNKVQYRRRGI